jgi:hypothetical protein
VTDLRDQLADFEAAAERALSRPHPHTRRLDDRISIATTLWHLRQQSGQSMDGLAARLGISRSGVHKRECDGRIPASALIAHARQLGYDLALIPRDDS